MNQEHLKVLVSDAHHVRQWNNWRKKHPETLPDLRKANLENWDFSNANFRRVNFEGANLAGAILCDADLSHANLSRTNLSGANLKRAILGETIFKGTALDNAMLHHAYMRATTFINVDLSMANGLDEIYHLVPSAIDFSTINTIYRSKGKIPEIFLRGAGIPAIFIEYIRSQGKNPFDYYSCFISYASENLSFVKSLHNHLEAKGVRCWFAPEDLKTGDRFPQLIEDAIHDYDKFIVVLSKDSIKSGWVKREVNIAREREHKGKDIFFPIFLDNTYLSSSASWVSYLRKQRNIENFQSEVNSRHYQKALQRLLDALKKDEC